MNLNPNKPNDMATYMTPTQQPAAVISNQPTITDEPESTTKPAKTITFKKISGWVDYTSLTGYSIQHPSYFTDASPGEEARDGSCYNHFADGNGGLLSVGITPYDGGSRRKLINQAPGYNYEFEDVLIQGKNSLLVQAGPIGESGSGTTAIIPAGKYALILFWSNRGKNETDFQSLLQTVKLQSVLDASKCNAQ